MKRVSFSRSDHGLTLIELLVVIAIVAILAALLLPALSGAKARALRVQCAQQLHELGVGFVSFAGDHHGRFPIAVPIAEGGSLEFATNGYRIQGDFYFSYRHFQTLSGELGTPKLLRCPADTRVPAISFASLNNSNLSYFVGVNADFSRPASILAGDRNLTNDYTSPGTLRQLGPNSALRWTAEMHQFKGDLLFADGHTEETTSAGLVAVVAHSGLTADLVVPTSGASGGTGVAGAMGNGGAPRPFGPGGAAARSPSGSAAPDAASGADTSTRVPSTALGNSARANSPRGSSTVVAAGSSQPAPAEPEPKKPATNAVTPASGPATAQPPPRDTEYSPIAAWLSGLMLGALQLGLWWFYALLVLVVAATLVARRLVRDRRKSKSQPNPD